MKRKKLVVLSVDAMVSDDVDYLSTLPNFKKYLSGYSSIKRVRSVYPTITYPVHVSISTGAYPNKHGVVSNFEFHPGMRKLPWNWFASAIKTTDLFTAAKKAGLSTASVFWPVTGNHKSIDYLIDEYWAQGKGDTSRAAFERSGSSREVLTKIVDKHIAGLVDRDHPVCDYFAVNCACSIIREFKPDLIMLHPANIDEYRHKTGLFTPQVKQGIREADEWIGQLFQAIRDARVEKETNFVLLSDHGQMEIKRVIHPNVIFADNGLIKVNEKGELTAWDAYCRSGGMSAFIYLKDPSDRAMWDKVYKLLCSMRDEGIYGIGEVFTEEEINKKEHLGGNFSFMIETDGYTSFGDAWVRPLVTSFDLSDYRFGRATHGYLPDKGPQPIFIAKGPSFLSDVEIGRRPIVDEAPTFAKVLGVDLPDADGCVIEELLK